MAAATVAPLVAALTVAVASLPVAAQPSSTGQPDDQAGIEVPEPVPGEAACTIADPRLLELSGLVALDDSYVVINDGGQAPEAQPIFFLDQECQVIDEIPYSAPGSRDPEALAHDRDAGVLWVGDIGDNFETTGLQERPTVAFWRIDLAGDRIPVIHRFAYPDGPHDAEALILDQDGVPVIVTKELDGPAGLYRPAAEMVANNPHEQAVPLERVGEFDPPDTGSSNALGPAGRRTITGGAVSPERDRVVLRTYADAFEFDVTDGDVVGAISAGTPRVTPLPDEPQGEAITYTPDGQDFLTVSETLDAGAGQPDLLRYQPTAPAVEEEPAGDAEPASPSLLDRLGWQGILNLIAGVGVVGLILVGAGVFGIVRARRRSAGRPSGGGESVTGAASARARVTPPDASAPARDQSPAPEPAAGVYTAGYLREEPRHEDARYEEPRYEGTRYGGPPAGPPPADPPQRGTVYGAGAGYQEHPFDQDLPKGYPEPGHGTPDHPGPAEAGGTYRAGTYHADYDEVPDYYYDDPDYSYEFRDRRY